MKDVWVFTISHLSPSKSHILLYLHPPTPDPHPSHLYDRFITLQEEENGNLLFLH